MTSQSPPEKSGGSGRMWMYIAAFLLAALAVVAIAWLLNNIQGKKDEAAQYPLQVVDIPDGTVDPAVWGQNFPVQYDSFKRTEENYGPTPYGGSEPYSKLEKYPALKRLWNGYAFAVDHNEERGHFYALTDQKETERIQIVDQPAACANCHTAEAPALIEELGWEVWAQSPCAMEGADSLPQRARSV